jgi:hypothetical protein
MRVGEKCHFGGEGGEGVIFFISSSPLEKKLKIDITFLREEHPDEDWFQLVGLIHDMGKIMAFYGEPQVLENLLVYCT